MQVLLWWHYETFHLNQKFIFKLQKNSLILTQKNTCRGGLRALSNMPKLWSSLKPLALAQNNNNNKNKIDLIICQDSEFACYLMLALLIVNLFQPLVAGNRNCPGKYRFLKFKYSQMITWKQAQSMENTRARAHTWLLEKQKWGTYSKSKDMKRFITDVIKHCIWTNDLNKDLNKFITFHWVSDFNWLK